MFEFFSRSKKTTLLWLVILVFAVVYLSIAYAARVLIPIKVVKVIDGDTLEAVLQDGSEAKIRLYGIDAPELKQPAGEEAKRRLEVLIRDKNTYIEIKGGRDKYNRIIALLYTTTEFDFSINAAMVREGYAWVYKDYCKDFFLCSDMLLEQTTASERRIGLWKEAPPYIPPWDYRKTRGLNN